MGHLSRRRSGRSRRGIATSRNVWAQEGGRPATPPTTVAAGQALRFSSAPGIASPDLITPTLAWKW